MAGGAVLAAAAVASWAAIPAARAGGSLSDYRLLVLNGEDTKWGSPALGSGASITFAMATGAIHTEDAINCGDLGPVDGVLAANGIGRAAFDAALDAAFAAWAAVADVQFTRVDDPANADIVIGAEMVARGRAFTNVATSLSSLPAGGEASARVAGLAGTITQSLICLSPGESWKIGFDGNLDVYDIQYTLLHEIGHAIGLDHPDGQNSVMDYHYTEAFSTLQPGDVAGAVALYGRRTVIAAAATGSLERPKPITP